MNALKARFGSLIRFALFGFDLLPIAAESRRLNNARGVES